MDKFISIMTAIWDYRFLILLVVTLILAVLIDLNVFKGKVKDAILKAENLSKAFILKSGAEEEQWVVDHLYLFISKRWMFIISRVLSEDQLRKIIKGLYKGAIDYIDDGKLNNSI